MHDANNVLKNDSYRNRFFIAAVIVCRVSKNVRHGSRFCVRRRSGTVRTLKWSKRTSRASSSHAMGVATGAFLRERTA